MYIPDKLQTFVVLGHLFKEQDLQGGMETRCNNCSIRFSRLLQAQQKMKHSPKVFEKKYLCKEQLGVTA